MSPISPTLAIGRITCDAGIREKKYVWIELNNCVVQFDRPQRLAHSWKRYYRSGKSAHRMHSITAHIHTSIEHDTSINRLIARYNVSACFKSSKTLDLLLLHFLQFIVLYPKCSKPSAHLKPFTLAPTASRSCIIEIFKWNELLCITCSTLRHIPWGIRAKWVSEHRTNAITVEKHHFEKD